MATVLPNGVVARDGGDPGAIAGLAEADSVDELIGERELHNYRWPTATDRENQVGAIDGDFGYQEDDDNLYVLTDGSWDRFIRAADITPTLVIASTTTTQNIGASFSNLTFAGTTPVVQGPITFNLATGDVTIGLDGLYQIQASVSFNATTSGSKAVQIHRNGSSIAGSVVTTATLFTHNPSVSVALVSGDVVSAKAFANVTTAIPVGGGYATQFQVVRLGDAA